MPQETTGDHSMTQGPPSDLSDSIFARRLRTLREQAETTQQQLADRMTAVGHKMHRSAIAKIESGDRPVSIGEAVQLAGQLGVTLMELITDDMADRGQEREYRQLVEAKLRVRSLQHEAARRFKLLEEAQVLYDNTVARLEAARNELSKWELRLKVGEQQARFGTSWWSQPEKSENDQ